VRGEKRVEEEGGRVKSEGTKKNGKRGKGGAKE
jgi:hypothetical protein